MNASGRGATLLEDTIRTSRRAGRPALAAFLTGGFPTLEGFGTLLDNVAGAAEVVEIGVPFTDPMADGITIQASSRRALEAGVTLSWILDTVGERPRSAPIVLMSYLNPLIALGIDTLAARARAAGVCGFIVPDLPYEESDALRSAFDPAGLALVQLVTPVTPADRLPLLCEASQGFVYAVTMTGVTGGNAGDTESIFGYLDRVCAVSPVPVLAGFGIRSASQVTALASHADGVIVGSALVEVIGDDRDPVAFLRSLRPATGITSKEKA